MILDAQYFTDYPNAMSLNEDGLSILEGGYRLTQKVRQPQAAMVICDNKSGAVIAMVGGLIIVPIVSALSRKCVPANVDRMFECYNDRTTVGITDNLGK